ncbi:MAG TPA: hydrogenase [Elusimicrobia bacterium]|nr:MAG: hydrogenase [Elusimicrobia bacterium GWA2_66_18]OGR75363.1 MAG: hydrogenase [Elusimicrobia bacterium GWC2_65_9]HAZ07588.1 hydrogenase [Elusimicrobiota bacterium]
MIYLLLVGVPFVIGLLALAVDSDERRPWLLPFGCAIHSSIVVACWRTLPEPIASGWFSIDGLGLLVLSLASAMLLVCSVYCLEYLRLRRERHNRLFTACLSFILGAVSLVCVSRHMGLVWVGMETATLAAAPLVYFNHNERSLEATWKYLMMGSLGIGLALLGTFFLALAALPNAGQGDPLVIDTLVARAGTLSVPWLRGAFIFLLVGYGTKMGLAPLHSWKPDAYGESPGVAGAILAGVITSCPFLGILRAFQICVAAGLSGFAQSLLVMMGLLSMATAAVFIIGQRDFKRMLAYSSVEHMGILVLGVGLGPTGSFAALLHLINNGLTKGVLFLTAGNIHRAFGGKTMDHAHGALRRVPISATLFLLGFVAITGSPPFAPFVSEFSILRAAVDGNRFGVALGFVGLLAVIFIGMATTVLSVVYGVPNTESKEPVQGDSPFMTLAPLVFMAAIVFLGLWLPNWLTTVLGDAAKLLNGGAS